MSQSYWGYWLVVMGVAVIGLMVSVQGITTNTTQDYYSIKEITDASMLEAVDYAYFRDYNEIKMDKEKFMEVFIRMISEAMGGTDTYEVNFYELYEAPPKVSVEVKSNSGTDFINVGEYDTVSRYDAILQIYAKEVGGSTGGSSKPNDNGSSSGGAGTSNGSGTSSGSNGSSGSTNPSTYTVNFDLNGGTGYIPSQTIASGSKVSKPSDPTRSGYDFNGWVANGSAYNFNSAVRSNFTLVASWKEKQNDIKTCSVVLQNDSSGKMIKVVDASTGRSVTSLNPGGTYEISFKALIQGPLSSDSGRITQQDLNKGFYCMTKQAGIKSSDNIIYLNGRYTNADMEYNFKGDPFPRYDMVSDTTFYATVKVPSNYSGRTVTFTAVYQGKESERLITETINLRVN